MAGIKGEALGRHKRTWGSLTTDPQMEGDRVNKVAIEARKAMAARGDVPEFVIRGARVADLALITDAWLASYRFGPVAQPIPRDIYQVEQRARVRRLITRSKCVCAVDPERPDQIKGWIVFEPPKGGGKAHYVAVHYVSVHPSLQNMGVGSTLIKVARMLNHDEDAPMWATHFTFPMRRLLERWNLIYNPYLLELTHDLT